MKKMMYTLFVMLLVGGLVSLAQIKPIKRQNSAKLKTESNTHTNGKTSKTNKRSKQNASGHKKILPTKSLPAVVQRLLADMVYVEGGSFMMGVSIEPGKQVNKSETPAHRVSLSSYYIGKYEVTQELWQAVMGNNPSYFTGNSLRPVARVTWFDCQEFIAKLNRLTGKHFRLPTEAEWEFAARGGNKSRGYKYSGSDTLDRVGWYKGNCDSTTHPVGQKAPNELGLYDMSGNVYEWCQDWYEGYGSGSQKDPSGPSSGSFRVYRGGSWDDEDWTCVVSRRGKLLGNPSSGRWERGLRLAASSL